MEEVECTKTQNKDDSRGRDIYGLSHPSFMHSSYDSPMFINENPPGGD